MFRRARRCASVVAVDHSDIWPARACGAMSRRHIQGRTWARAGMRWLKHGGVHDMTRRVMDDWRRAGDTSEASVGMMGCQTGEGVGTANSPPRARMGDWTPAAMIARSAPSVMPKCSETERAPATSPRPPRSSISLKPLPRPGFSPPLPSPPRLPTSSTASSSRLAMFATRTASWSCLPAEMKLSIVDQLDLDDVRTFAKVDREAYNLSIPALFRVRLSTHLRASTRMSDRISRA